MTQPYRDSSRRPPDPDAGTASDARASSRRAPRRPYVPPHLECYGGVEDLVRQFGGGPLSDSGNNRMAPFTPPS